MASIVGRTAPMRLLFVDDHPVRTAVIDQLEKEDVRVTAVATSAAGLAELHDTTFDVVLIGLQLPDGRGADLLQALRETSSPAYVIVLGDQANETDRVRVIELGADDYVVKPFSVRELTARVLAVRRRYDRAASNTLRYGPIVIDIAARQVTVDGQPIVLTAKEFELLAYLAARPRHAFTRDELLRAVWQSATDWQQSSTVTEHMRRLRSKIEADATAPRLLQTVRGVGYRFDPPPDDPHEGAAGVSPVEQGGSVEGCAILVDGLIVSADPPVVALLGAASEAALLGREAVDLIDARSRAAVRDRRKAIEAGRQAHSQVISLRRDDGRSAIVEMSSSAGEWNGQAARVVTIRPSPTPSAHLRTLAIGVFSEVSDAIIVTDPQFHVRSWNAAAERLYGWAEDEVLGRHLVDVLPFVEDGTDLGSSIQTLEDNGRWHGEGVQIARDGSLVRVYGSTTMIRDESGDVDVIVSVNRPAATTTTPFSDDLEEADLRRGLDNAEFDVHYQPVVALDDLHVIAVEALVRWNHPERGLLTPASFIDVAERSGLMLELGRVVFEIACQQTALWRRAGIDLQVAINLSTKQLADAALFDDITATLAASGLAPHLLWLEVTETTLIEDVERAADLLGRLAANGTRIAIDDFGTGWASLTYLKQFTVHALKIDRTFVDGVHRNPRDMAIARSIMALGAELDLIVVAEGVETVAQQAALRDLGCPAAQGFLYGRPTPAAQVPIHRAHLIDAPSARDNS